MSSVLFRARLARRQRKFAGHVVFAVGEVLAENGAVMSYDDLPLDDRVAVKRRMTAPPIPAPVIGADGSVRWPKDWSPVRKAVDIDFLRRAGTANPASPIASSSMVEILVADLRREIGTEEADALIEARKQIQDEKFSKWRAEGKLPPLRPSP